MSAQQELSHLIRKTTRAIEQQVEYGIDAVFMPEGLSSLIDVKSLADTNTGSIRKQGQIETLQALYDTHCNCINCDLGHRRKQFVFGSGNEQADVMFIGEAPGADEDAKGLPFVGAAGQLLTKILEAIDFKRDEVYIANILKCRPPNNRDPQPDEVEACEPILREQIRLIQPKLICALGRVAGQALLKTNTSLGRLRGRFHEYEGTKLLVTYHPSALLRNPSFKRPTWEDVQMLRQEYEKIQQS